jgi:tight adherence protein B
VTALLAAAAAALGVLAAWEALAAVEASAAARAARHALAPLGRLGRDGREPSPPERRRLARLLAGALLAAGWLLAGPLAGLALAAGGPRLLGAVVRERRRRHRAALERAAPAVARALADALGAGLTIPAALAEAARGCDPADAVAVELRACADALALGASLEVALARLCARAGSRAWDVLAAAILLQRDAGGDLATLLRELAAAQEEAARLLGEARAATTQARFTGLVVALLPAGAAALAELASPGALTGLAREPLTAWLAGFALVLQAIALVAIRRLARVRP